MTVIHRSSSYQPKCIDSVQPVVVPNVVHARVPKASGRVGRVNEIVVTVVSIYICMAGRQDVTLLLGAPHQASAVIILVVLRTAE